MLRQFSQSTILAGLLAVVLVGCATPQQAAKIDHARCVAEFGFQIGTDGYAGCRVLLSERRGDTLMRVGRALQGFGQGYNANRSTTRLQTTCVRMGSILSCQ